MPRHPSHYFYVQWDRKRDIEGILRRYSHE